MPDDGVTVLPGTIEEVPTNKDSDMAEVIDLPPNAVGLLLKEGSESHQQNMAEIRTNSTHIHNFMRLSSARRFDQLEIGESKAQSGLAATDMGGPSNPPRGGKGGKADE